MNILAFLPLFRDEYRQKEIRWRTSEEQALRSDWGWLSVAGLYWLKAGDNSIGTAEDNDFRIPNGHGPAHLGTVQLVKGRATFRFAEGVSGMIGGQALQASDLISDAEQNSSRIDTSGLTLTLIQRGKRLGLRLYDSESPRRKAFGGLRWYAVDSRYRIQARFVRYPKPKEIPITNVLGDVRLAPCPGYAEFRLDGKLCRLLAEDEGSTYFFNFGDRTNNRTTYGAGRFLNAPKPKGETIVLDFNRATNPPCAFTDFATCPLPPRGNVLSVPVKAGALNGHAQG